MLVCVFAGLRSIIVKSMAMGEQPDHWEPIFNFGEVRISLDDFAGAGSTGVCYVQMQSQYTYNYYP